MAGTKFHATYVLYRIIKLNYLPSSIVNPTNTIIHGMEEGASQVAAASGQVSSSSQSMAQGASRQAASIQETSASMEHIYHEINDPKLDFAAIKNIAKAMALERSGSPILLSWENSRAGIFYPDRECGKNEKPPWIYYAEARGANLTVDVNNVDYIFMFLKLDEKKD